MKQLPQIERTSEQYNVENTEIRIHNLVETWLLDSEGYLIAYFNVGNGESHIFSYATIEQDHATNLILHHLNVAVNRDRARNEEEHKRISQAVYKSPLYQGCLKINLAQG